MMMRARKVARGEEMKWDDQVWYSEARSDREGGSEVVGGWKVRWRGMLCGLWFRVPFGGVLEGGQG